MFDGGKCNVAIGQRRIKQTHKQSNFTLNIKKKKKPVDWLMKSDLDFLFDGKAFGFQ